MKQIKAFATANLYREKTKLPYHVEDTLSSVMQGFPILIVDIYCNSPDVHEYSQYSMRIHSNTLDVHDH